MTNSPQKFEIKRPERSDALAQVAEDVVSLPSEHIKRVAIDGVDGAGKTYFADELAAELRRSGTAVIRASVDGFHNPREVRYRRGRNSPEGFFRDSYDYRSLIKLLLAPLSPGGSGRYVPRIHDVDREQPAQEPQTQASEGAILVFDGIFALRDELRPFWDYSVWLDVPFEESVSRSARRDHGDPNPHADANRRYVEGQRIYMQECAPRERATVVIQNENLDHPVLIRRALSQ